MFHNIIDLDKISDMPVNALLKGDDVFIDVHRFEECRITVFFCRNSFFISRIMSKDKEVEDCL